MNKYNATKTEYNGIKFDSKLEARIYKGLMELKSEGYINFVALQVPYELLEKYENVNGDKIRAINYKCDFVVIDRNNRELIIDSKGFETPLFKIKKKLFEYKYNKILHTVNTIKGIRKLIIG